MSDQERLLDLASAVAAGSDVNWDDVERNSKNDRERSVVREMRLIADIAEIARDPSSQRTGRSSGEHQSDLVHPQAWGYLRVMNQVGNGSFGKVYRAWDSRLERDVALKLVPSCDDSDSFDLSRAIKEARLLARVRHPNVVSVLGADCHDDRFGLWMEFINGQTLEAILTAQGTMSAREATAIGVDLCHALAAVHRARLLHRDIKASNVMREEGGRIVLMDFGAGRRMPAPDDPVAPLAGTPLYLAPELLKGGKPSVASDIYSLGVLLYHLVTGEYPVIGKDRTEVAQAHEARQRATLRDARPDVPSSFADAVERALEPDPENRYETAGEFGATLAALTGARYEPDPRTMPDWRLVAVAAVAIAVVIGIAVVPDTKRPASPQPQAGTSQPADAAAPLPSSAGSYEVMAAFYASRKGENVRLAPGSRVEPGDRLFLTLEASRPVFVYVVNQDETGRKYLLFPLPGYEPQNPIPIGAVNRLPGFRNGAAHHWEVTSAGGREHFLLYAAAERLVDFERKLAELPRAEENSAVESLPLSEDAVMLLRGVGGVKRMDPAADQTLLDDPALKPLLDAREVASGVWARRITFDNPRP